jgi:hypothetical protein
MKDHGFGERPLQATLTLAHVGLIPEDRPTTDADQLLTVKAGQSQCYRIDFENLIRFRIEQKQSISAFLE